jgi:hypothetical protein
LKYALILNTGSVHFFMAVNWLAENYATTREVAGSITDEVNGFFFFFICLMTPAAPWLEVY